MQSGATSFTFARMKGAYSAAVKSQPTGLNNAVTNGSGTASANMSNVNVSCSASICQLGSFTARSATEANTWAQVKYLNNTFVAVADSGTKRVMTSPDGITWTAKDAAVANGWRSVAFGNNSFVAVSGDGTNRVMTANCQ